MSDPAKLQGRIDALLEHIDQVSSAAVGIEVPPMESHWVDQFTAGIRDDFANLGVDAGSDELYAAMAGMLLITALWEALGFPLHLGQCYGLAHLLRLLQTMVSP